MKKWRDTALILLMLCVIAPMMAGLGVRKAKRSWGKILIVIALLILIVRIVWVSVAQK
jgi:uncharacterized membrane protein YtjA (UPF0391 family)